LSLRPRITRATALAGLLLASPALADNKKVTLSQAFQSVIYLPLYVAIDEGFFTQQGVDPTKEPAVAPTGALAAVISGSGQFSIHGPEWTAIAASKGAPVNIISNVVNGAAVWIATTPDFKFESIKDIKGQKVVTGLMPATGTSLFIKLLKENGMDAKTDVDMIQVALGSEPGPFIAKQANIAVMSEPGLDQVVAKGMKVVLGFPKSYGPYAFSAVTARNDVDPDTAQRRQWHGNGDALHDQARSQDCGDREEGIPDPRPGSGGSRGEAHAARRHLSAERGYQRGRAQGLHGPPDRARQSGSPAGLQDPCGEKVHRIGGGDEIACTRAAL